MARVNLGDEAKCLVTGFKGIAIARTEWLNGCVRVTLQSKMDKDGKITDGSTFDEPQLQVTKAGALKLVPPFRRDRAGVVADNGGPIPTPRQHPGPVRR